MRRWARLFPAIVLSASRLGAAADILYPKGADPVGASASGPAGGLGTYTVVVAAACALAGAWLLWRSRRQAAGPAKGKLSVSETRSLGNRQYLVVASYGEKKFLIGVCVGRITLLAPLDDGTNPTAG